MLPCYIGQNGKHFSKIAACIVCGSNTVITHDYLGMIYAEV